MIFSQIIDLVPGPILPVCVPVWPSLSTSYVSAHRWYLRDTFPYSRNFSWTTSPLPSFNKPNSVSSDISMRKRYGHDSNGKGKWYSEAEAIDNIEKMEKSRAGDSERGASCHQEQQGRRGHATVYSMRLSVFKRQENAAQAPLVHKEKPIPSRVEMNFVSCVLSYRVQ